MPAQWEVRRPWHRGWMLLCAAVVSCGKPPRRHRHRHDTGTTKTRRANVRPPKCPEKSRVVSAKATTVQFHAGIRLCHTHTGQHEDSVRPESSRLQLSCDIRHHVFDTGVHAVVHPPGIVLAAEVMSISSGSSSCCFGGGQSNQQRIFGWLSASPSCCSPLSGTIRRTRPEIRRAGPNT